MNANTSGEVGRPAMLMNTDRRQRNSSLALKHGVVVPHQVGEELVEETLLYPELVLRGTHLSCPQENHRRHSRQVGPSTCVPGSRLLLPARGSAHLGWAWEAGIPSPLWKVVIREQLKICRRKLELPISKQLGFFFFKLCIS